LFAGGKFEIDNLPARAFPDDRLELIAFQNKQRKPARVGRPLEAAHLSLCWEEPLSFRGLSIDDPNLDRIRSHISWIAEAMIVYPDSIAKRPGSSHKPTPVIA